MILEKDSLFETTVFNLFSFNVPFCELVLSLQNAGGKCGNDSFKSYYRLAC